LQISASGISIREELDKANIPDYLPYEMTRFQEEEK
jgi:hypothetical protein